MRIKSQFWLLFLMSCVSTQPPTDDESTVLPPTIPQTNSSNLIVGNPGDGVSGTANSTQVLTQSLTTSPCVPIVDPSTGLSSSAHCPNNTDISGTVPPPSIVVPPPSISNGGGNTAPNNGVGNDGGTLVTAPDCSVVPSHPLCNAGTSTTVAPIGLTQGAIAGIAAGAIGGAALLAGGIAAAILAGKKSSAATAAAVATTAAVTTPAPVTPAPPAAPVARGYHSIDYSLDRREKRTGYSKRTTEGARRRNEIVNKIYVEEESREKRRRSSESSESRLRERRRKEELEEEEHKLKMSRLRAEQKTKLLEEMEDRRRKIERMHEDELNIIGSQHVHMAPPYPMPYPILPPPGYHAAGVQGVQGAQGAQGPPGRDGRVIHSGVVVLGDVHTEVVGTVGGGGRTRRDYKKKFKRYQRSAQQHLMQFQEEIMQEVQTQQHHQAARLQSMAQQQRSMWSTRPYPHSAPMQLFTASYVRVFNGKQYRQDFSYYSKHQMGGEEAVVGTPEGQQAFKSVNQQVRRAAKEQFRAEQRKVERDVKDKRKKYERKSRRHQVEYASMYSQRMSHMKIGAFGRPRHEDVSPPSSEDERRGRRTRPQDPFRRPATPPQDPFRRRPVSPPRVDPTHRPVTPPYVDPTHRPASPPHIDPFKPPSGPVPPVYGYEMSGQLHYRLNGTFYGDKHKMYFIVAVASMTLSVNGDLKSIKAEMSTHYDPAQGQLNQIQLQNYLGRVTQPQLKNSIITQARLLVPTFQPNQHKIVILYTVSRTQKGEKTSLQDKTGKKVIIKVIEERGGKKPSKPQPKTDDEQLRKVMAALRITSHSLSTFWLIELRKIVRPHYTVFAYFPMSLSMVMNMPSQTQMMVAAVQDLVQRKMMTFMQENGISTAPQQVVRIQARVKGSLLQKPERVLFSLKEY